MTRLGSLLLIVASLVLVSTSVYADDAGAWTDGACNTRSGVTVVVDFQELGGGTYVRCATGSVSSGFAALQQAGIHYQTAVRFPGFLCKIAGKPENDPCINASPASAYWSYWVAPRGGSWCYSNFGAGNRTPSAGSVEGWSFSFDKTGSTSPPPRIAPPAPIPGVAPSPLPKNDCDSSSTAPSPPTTTRPATTTTRPRPPSTTPGPTSPAGGSQGGGVGGRGASTGSGASNPAIPGNSGIPVHDNKLSTDTEADASVGGSGDAGIGAAGNTLGSGGSDGADGEIGVLGESIGASPSGGAGSTDGPPANSDSSHQEGAAASGSSSKAGSAREGEVDLGGGNDGGSAAGVLVTGLLITVLGSVALAMRRRAASH